MAKAKRVPRKNSYDLVIKPNFKRIADLLQVGATEDAICKEIGVSSSIWYKYKAQKKEFSELCKQNRRSVVHELRGALLKKALGFEYTETKTYIRTNANGEETSTTEIIKKQALPDVAALNLALKNYDRDNWSNDWQTHEIKLKELALKQKAFENENWEG